MPNKAEEMGVAVKGAPFHVADEGLVVFVITRSVRNDGFGT